MSGLTIYRASAGSGKTYTLARDFISLVIKDQELFRHVLAVTFTNKATDEMKGRILEELHRLATGQDSAMLGYIAAENGLSAKEVSGRAGLILQSVLHNYSRFHIETIDRFFQRAIRSFTREIGLTGGYQVELDSEKVLSAAIDEMLNGLEKEPGLLEWFVEFARDKVQDGKHWNLKKDLLDLGKQLTKERFQEESSELQLQLEDREAFHEFRMELGKLRHSFESRLRKTAGEALEIMVSAGLEPGDFKGQYGPPYFFGKLLGGNFEPPTPTILRSVDEPSEWYTKNSPRKKEIMAVYEAGMNGKLKECLSIYDSGYRDYISAGAVSGFMYSLGILTDISRRMQEYTESEGLFLLSDSARFLHGIIDGNEAPFVYEKIGNYFHHFMIDEFQDTSGLQWKNFRPLIANSLALNQECLVVGDVKQSIYRWRNSDWEILSEQLEKDFTPGQLRAEGLKHNWRSLENVVSFNNGFFSRAREIFIKHFTSAGREAFAGKTDRAYQDVVQEIPLAGRGGGKVSIHQLGEPEEGNWKDVSDLKVIRTIEELQDQGIKASEILILVRYKKDGKRIADSILEHKTTNTGNGYVYDVVSNEALYLYSALSVRIMVAALRFLVSPDDRINLAQLLLDYHLYSEENSIAEISPDEILKTIRREDQLPLPESFMDKSLRYLTLTELLERIISLLELNNKESETAYILGFQDLVLDYCRSGPADINSFLKWWEEYGKEKSLAVSEEQEAINVMTVHKAKGLEYRAVIVPYCNWSFDHRANSEILWCRSERVPFSRYSLLPVKYMGELDNSHFSQQYREEQFRAYMDNLNLLYVAFTRAKESLTIMVPPPPKKETFKDVSALVRKILMEGLDRGEWDPLGSVWSVGKDLSVSEESADKGQIILKSLSNHPFSGKLRLRYRGLDFFDPEAEVRVHLGTLMHEIFSRIRTIRDIDPALESVRREGMIDLEQVSKLKDEITRLMEDKQVKEWFDGSWRVIAEQDILSPGGTVRRPDRVMIKPGKAVVVDYKTGKTRSSSHLSQVREYMDKLIAMDAGEVRGFVWYVKLEEIKEVL